SALEVGKAGRISGDKGAVGDLGRPGEAGIMVGQIDLADEAVGGFDISHAGKLQLLGQTVLESAEHAFRAPARFRRVGGNVHDAKPSERPAAAGPALLVDRLDSLAGADVVAPALGDEAGR